MEFRLSRFLHRHFSSISYGRKRDREREREWKSCIEMEFVKRVYKFHIDLGVYPTSMGLSIPEMASGYICVCTPMHST